MNTNNILSEKDCLFCKMVRGELPAIKVFEDAEVFSIMDLYPATPGHILVLTKQHIENIYTLPESLGAHIMKVAIKISQGSKKLFISGWTQPDSGQRTSGMANHSSFSFAYCASI